MSVEKTHTSYPAELASNRRRMREPLVVIDEAGQGHPDEGSRTVNSLGDWAACIAILDSALVDDQRGRP
jgi:hypothetical protein